MFFRVLLVGFGLFGLGAARAPVFLFPADAIYKAKDKLSNKNISKLSSTILGVKV